MAKFILEKILTNSQGQDGSSVAVYTDENETVALRKATVAYHQTLATYENADDVRLAAVSIRNEYGVNVPVSNIVEHLPEE